MNSSTEKPYDSFPDNPAKACEETGSNGLYLIADGRRNVKEQGGNAETCL